MLWLIWIYISTSLALRAPDVKLEEDAKTGLSITVTSPEPVQGISYFIEAYNRQGDLIWKNRALKGQWQLIDCRYSQITLYYTKNGSFSETTERDIGKSILSKPPPLPVITQSKETPDSIEVSLKNGIWFDKLTNHYYQYAGDKRYPLDKQNFTNDRTAITECEATRLEVFASTKCGLDSPAVSVDLTSLLMIPQPPVNQTWQVVPEGLRIHWMPPAERPELIADYLYIVFDKRGLPLKSGLVKSSVFEITLNDCDGVEVNFQSQTRCRMSENISSIALKGGDYPSPLKPEVLEAKLDWGDLRVIWRPASQGMPTVSYLIDFKSLDGKTKPIHVATNKTRYRQFMPTPANVSIRAVGQLGKESETKTVTIDAPDAPQVVLTEDREKGVLVNVRTPKPSLATNSILYRMQVYRKDGKLLNESDNSQGEWQLINCHATVIVISYKQAKQWSKATKQSLENSILSKPPPAPFHTQAKETPGSIEVTLGNGVWFDQLTNYYYQYIDGKRDPPGKQQFKEGKAAITECKATKLEVFAVTKCGLDSSPFTIDLTKLLTMPKPPREVTKDVQSDCILTQWKPPSEEPELITNYKYEVVGQDGTVLKSGQVDSSITKLALNDCHGVKLNLYSTTRCKLSEQAASLTMDEQDYPAPLKPIVAGEMVDNKLKASWTVGDQSMSVGKFIIDIKPKDASAQPIHAETTDDQGEYNVLAPLELSVKAVGQCGKESDVATIQVNRSENNSFSLTLFTTIATILSLTSTV